jgi:transcriptional antiterminator NusG
MAKQWFVIHAHSGFEKSVKRALLERIARAGLEDKFGDILVPTEEVVEMKSGQKNVTERKFFPGYLLVEMELSDDTWHLVRKTNKVSGFVGGTPTKPAAIPPEEVALILNQVQEGTEKPRPKVLYEMGESVRIKEGPFLDFNGQVTSLDYDRSKATVAVIIFGRSTPVELDFTQIEKT